MIKIQINDKMRLVFAEEDEKTNEVSVSYEVRQKSYHGKYMWYEMDDIVFDTQAQLLDWLEACERLKKLLVLK